jgi:hypothetical protein
MTRCVAQCSDRKQYRDWGVNVTYLAKGTNPKVLAEDELSYLDRWLFHNDGLIEECEVGD